MKDFITRAGTRLGIDLSIFYTILARVIQSGGGIVIIVLISLFLTKEEQGYYYTFGSILAIQIFFELGITSVITQYVAHESIDISWVSDKELIGPQKNLSRLASILSLCLKVFGVLSISLFVILLISGFYFFSTFKGGLVDVNWQIPWIIISLATAMLLVVNPLLAFLEGLGQVKEVAKIRMKQQLVSLITIILILSLKGGLYAQGIASIISFLILSGSILFSRYKHFLLTIYRQTGPWKISYRQEIFPYQYKIALSWVSGYLLFQLFNPILFATQGATVAGQMGITLTALNGVSTIAMSWISTKTTLFSSLIARKDFEELDKIFNKTVRQLILISVVLLFLFVLIVESIKVINLPLRERFLPLLPIILLCLTTFVNQIIFSWATYLRCHKQEPFLFISIINGLLNGFSTVVLGHYFGVVGMVAGSFILTTLIGGIGGYYIFITKKREWHGV